MMTDPYSVMLSSPVATTTPTPTTTATPTATPTPPPGGFTVNSVGQFQTVNGFGSDLDGLPVFSQSTIDLGYKPFPAGIGLTYGRLGVTADGAPQGPGDSDGPWTNAQEVTADGGQLWADPNTAPAAWKSNNSVTCGGSLLSSHFTDYANQLNGFLTTGIAQGATMYGLTKQNEPSQASCQFQSMTMNGTDYVNFLKVLGPIVRGAHPAAKIMVAENVEWTELWNPYVVQIAGDATALSFVDIYSALWVRRWASCAAEDRSSNLGAPSGLVPGPSMAQSTAQCRWPRISTTP